MNLKLHTGARIIFGLIFFVFGVNGFLKIIPTPPVTAEAGALLGAFASTGYFLPMIKVLEAVTGLLLLLNLFAPLAVILLTPVLLGITTIHLFLNPAGLPMMAGIHILHLFLVVGYFKYYKSTLTQKASAF